MNPFRTILCSPGGQIKPTFAFTGTAPPGELRVSLDLQLYVKEEGGFSHLGMKDLPCIPESIERLPQRRVGVEGVWVTMAMGERKRDVEEDNGVVNRYSRVNLRAEERHQGHIVVLLSWWEDYFVIFPASRLCFVLFCLL